jgi:3-hydroxybutyryl-CoA dehydrogenase
MPRVQLLADAEYFSSYATSLEKIDGVELVGQSPDILFDAVFLAPELKLSSLSRLDVGSALIVTNTLTVSATTARAAISEERTVVGVPVFPNYFARQSVIEYSTPFGIETDTSTIEGFLEVIGKKGERVKDAIAGVFPRTLAMIVNEGAFAVEEEVATPSDIDLAMKLGTNYPMGPLAWCDEIGAKAIVAVLDALQTEYDPARYRVAPLLRRHAESGITFFPTADPVAV